MAAPPPAAGRRRTDEPASRWRVPERSPAPAEVAARPPVAGSAAPAVAPRGASGAARGATTSGATIATGAGAGRGGGAGKGRRTRPAGFEVLFAGPRGGRRRSGRQWSSAGAAAERLDWSRWKRGPCARSRTISWCCPANRWPSTRGRSRRRGGGAGCRRCRANRLARGRTSTGGRESRVASRGEEPVTESRPSRRLKRRRRETAAELLSSRSRSRSGARDGRERLPRPRAVAAMAAERAGRAATGIGGGDRKPKRPPRPIADRQAEAARPRQRRFGGRRTGRRRRKRPM